MFDDMEEMDNGDPIGFDLLVNEKDKCDYRYTHRDSEMILNKR